MRNTDADESAHKRRRTRVFHEGWRWFYHTRNGPRGPFESRQIAMDDLTHYVETVNFVAQHPNSCPEQLDLSDVTHIDLKLPRY